MRGCRIVACAGVVFFGGLALGAQQGNPQSAPQAGTGGEAVIQVATPSSAGVGTVVPRLVQFSGVVTESTGKPATGAVMITFSLNELQEGGTPLWTETQSVVLDEQGHYTVFLGAASPNGLPLDLFTSGAARWLGVAPAVPSVGEQPRVLLVGVPYALKAADADTLGGLPASAFVQSGAAPGLVPGTGASTANAPSRSSTSASALSGQQGMPPRGKSNTVVADYIPYWNGSTTFGNSTIYQSGTNLGIGTTTPYAGLDLQGGGILRVGGSAAPAYPTAGQGFEVAFSSAEKAGGGSGSGVSLFQSYSRDASAWRDLWIRGLNTALDANGKTALYLSSAGDVGLGTTAPGTLLDLQGGGILRVGGSAAPAYPTTGQGFEAAFNSGAAAGGGSGSGVSLFQSYSRDAKAWRDLWFRGLNMAFDANGTTAMYLSNAGNVGIGTTTPAATLEVNGTAKFDQAVTFASGQTFPGAASLGSNNFVGNETITGNLTVASNGTISLGTTDGALVIQPNANPDNGANVIAGFTGNSVAAGTVEATIAGGGAMGEINTVSCDEGTVGGGDSNTAGCSGAVGGGDSNGATGINSTVAGGSQNTASNTWSTVGGGSVNTASGVFATVPGGAYNSAQGDSSFAAGKGAQAIYDGTFVWADMSTGTTISSTAPNEFIVRAAGGLWLGTDNFVSIPAGQFIATSTGAYLSTGGTWTNASDRNLKDNFTSVNQRDVLKRVAALPMFTWNYKAQPSSVRHLGPTAQDFHAAFGLGEDDKHISTVDAEGVAFAAIQELYKRSQESEARSQNKDAKVRELYRLNRQKSAQIRQLTAKVAKLESLESRMAAFQARLDRLEAGTGKLEAKNRDR